MLRPRAYQSNTPSSNPILGKIRDMEIYVEHRERVLNARPTIDTKPPISLKKRLSWPKKQLFSSKQVHRWQVADNAMMKKVWEYQLKGGLIDNVVKVKPFISRFESGHRQNVKRIMEENLQQLKRINMSETSYNSLQFESDHQMNQIHVAHSSKYYHPWKKSWREMLSGKDKVSNLNRPTSCFALPIIQKSAVNLTSVQTRRSASDPVKSSSRKI